ncbi:MAG TPA: phosphoglycerate dehydrogenase [Steroidobacteraceae bacterium]|jgi:D-3-phosphoglycerate dehydrogenase|nr:phosphoglycerate dehydrogenase [Steroidobacteraceae bacterium]
MSYRILTLNQISGRGLSRLPRDRYEVGPRVTEPDAILLRSADLHGFAIPGPVRAVGRAGAGVNNIPVDQLSRRGIPVFNTPGANANAVKELVLAGLLLAARNIGPAWLFARGLDGDDEAIEAAVEKGKKSFVGFELPGRTLGVVGLGAVGVEVANSALALGMKVLGYDPQLTLQRAWQLSSSVEQARSLEDLFTRADAITLHVPLNKSTEGLVNGARLALMKPEATLLNFARAAIVEREAVLAALDARRLHAYVCDFPSHALKDHPRVITLPHLGASTTEAEENCAVMVVEQLRDFLENGNVRNSVNFPEAVLPRVPNTTRLAVANRNVPNMVGQISTCLAGRGINIADLLNKSRGEYAYTLIDVDGAAGEELLEKIRAIEGVLSARII